MATEIIKTIKPAGGGDFLTLNAWIATLAGRNLVSFDEVQVAETFAGGNLVVPSSVLVIPSSITTDATRFIHIRAGPGEHITGAPFTTSKVFAEFNVAGGASPFDIDVADCRITGIQLRSIAQSGRIIIYGNVPNGFYVVEECLLISDGPIGVSFPFTILYNPGAGGGAGGNGPNGNNLVINNIFLFAVPDSITQGAGLVIFPRGSQTKVDALNNTIILTPLAGTGSGMGTTDAAGLFTDNNYIQVGSGGVAYGVVTVKGANDVTSNGEATTPARRNIPYDASNFRNPTDIATTFDVHLPVGSALIDDGLDIATVVNDVSGVAR